MFLPQNLPWESGGKPPKTLSNWRWRARSPTKVDVSCHRYRVEYYLCILQRHSILPLSMPPRSSSRRVSVIATPKVSKDGSAAKKNTPTSTRSGRTIKKPDTTSPYFNKSIAKRGKEKLAQNESEEVDSHEPTGLTSEEENSSDDGESSEDEFGLSEDDKDGAGVEDSESESELTDSDLLDESDDSKSGRGKKRGSSARNAKPPSKRAKLSAKATGQASSGKKKEPKNKVGDHEYIEGYDNEEDNMTDTDLEDGQEIAGRIYPAPKTGQGERVRTRRMETATYLVNPIQFPPVKYHEIRSIFLKTFKYQSVMIATGLNPTSRLSGRLKRQAFGSSKPDLSLQNRTAGVEGFCRHNATTIE